MPRKSAPGLDGLLRWAFELGASRIAFSTGKPVKLRVHGRNRFVTLGLLDEGEIADVTNHLYGSDGIARLQNGSDFDVAYEIAVDRDAPFILNVATHNCPRSGWDGSLRSAS